MCMYINNYDTYSYTLTSSISLMLSLCSIVSVNCPIYIQDIKFTKQSSKFPPFDVLYNTTCHLASVVTMLY